ncbi:hypothetical protein RYA05_00925 [Pseudomonas syringae pv. actinidiae]|nr:hypothetical protein [Pseudomonas syringae pv. actinidiae]
MKKLLLGLSLLTVTSGAMAEETTCQITPELSRVKAVQWDSNKRTAVMKDMFGSVFVGTVTAIRPLEHGFKTNMEFKYSTDIIKDRIIEVLVLPTTNNTYRLISEVYVNHEGKRVLDIPGGNSSASCETL